MWVKECVGVGLKGMYVYSELERVSFVYIVYLCGLNKTFVYSMFIIDY